MTKINDLTQGSISKGIWSMAIPLITASFSSNGIQHDRHDLAGTSR